MTIKASKKTTRLIVLFLCFVMACSFAGCTYPSSTSAPSKSSSSENIQEIPKSSDKTWNAPKSSTPATPQYEDSRWPTTNPELLAMPESNRWYNAWDSAGTSCTIAGPVVNVYQAKESSGMPIFIDIGTKYPSSNSVTLVVWADQYDDFSQMINAVDDGGAWLSVTGYLGVYNGMLQFNADDPLEYTWWTNVS